MRQKTVVIKNNAGIHCRPSGVIVAIASKYPGMELRAESDSGNADLHSILDLLSLGLKKGDSVTVKVNGNEADEGEVCEKLAELFETEFDFKR